MGKSYLVPDQIVDVNGKTTTVYRRVDTTAPTGASLPAPKVAGAPVTPAKDEGAPVPSAKPLMHRLIPALARQAEAKERAELLHFIHEYIQPEANNHFLSTDALRKVKDILASLPGTGSVWGVREVIRTAARHASLPNYSPNSLNDVDIVHANIDSLPLVNYEARGISRLYHALGPLLPSLKVDNIAVHLRAMAAFPEEHFPAQAPYSNSIAYVHAIHKHPDRVETLMKWAEVVASDEKACRELKHGDPEKFIRLVDKFPGREDDIFTFMRDRGFRLPTEDELTEMLEHHSAINEGWL